MADRETTIDTGGSGDGGFGAGMIGDLDEPHASFRHRSCGALGGLWRGGPDDRDEPVLAEDPDQVATQRERLLCGGHLRQSYRPVTARWPPPRGRQAPRPSRGPPERNGDAIPRW